MDGARVGVSGEHAPTGYFAIPETLVRRTFGRLVDTRRLSTARLGALTGERQVTTTWTDLR